MLVATPRALREYPGSKLGTHPTETGECRVGSRSVMAHTVVTLSSDE